MKINVTDTKKLESTINAAQKGCRVRLIDVETIQYAISCIEEKLLPRLYIKDWVGIDFLVDFHGQSFPNAYRGSPQSTQFRIKRYVSGWFITAIFRDYTKSLQYYPINLHSKADALADFAANTKNWN